MSTALEHLEILYKNPFSLSPNLVQFYLSLGEKRQSLLLAYLVVPLLLKGESRNALTRTNKRSSIFTFTQDRTRIYGLNESVIKTKNLVNNCLQHAVDSGWVTILENNVIQAKVATASELSVNESERRACERFAQICKPHDVRTIYRTFGIRSI